MMLSTRATAALQAVNPPATVIPAHELYVVPLKPPPSFVNTPALMYMLARMASAAPLVKRPLLDASRVLGRSVRAARSSDSMNLKTESRESRDRGWTAVVVTTG